MQGQSCFDLAFHQTANRYYPRARLQKDKVHSEPRAPMRPLCGDCQHHRQSMIGLTPKIIHLFINHYKNNMNKLFVISEVVVFWPQCTVVVHLLKPPFRF